MEDQSCYYDQVYKEFLDNKEEMIDAFFSKGNNNSTSGFLLSSALLKRHRSFFESLLEHNADVNWKDCYGRSLLEIAILKKDSNSVKSLLNHDADINISTEINFFESTYKGTLLHIAAIRGNIEIVKLLLEKGMDVNCRTRIGDTIRVSPVYYDMLCFRQLNVLELFVRNMYIYIYNEEKQNIFHLLLENGATLDDESEQIHTLHLAIYSRAPLFVIKKLIEYGANINSVCGKQCTPLSHAALSGHIDKETVFYLLKKGAILNVNTINSDFDRFLSNDFNFCEQVFALFVDSGADINLKNEIGDTPLQRLVKKYNVCNNQVKFLLDYGSNINVQNKNGDTLLHLSVKKRNVNCVDILLEYEAYLTFTNEWGETPLMALSRTEIRFELREALSNRISNMNCSTYFGKKSCLIIRATVINAESGKHVNEDDLHFVKTELRFLYDSFKNELEKVKLKKVRENFSYYDILTKSVSVLETCVNKEVLENIESSQIEEEFPLYDDMLRMRIRKIKERQTLVEFCQKRFKALFHLEYEPPILIKEKMLSYLNSVDLITLWRVFKQHGDYLSKFLNRPEGMRILELNE